MPKSLTVETESVTYVFFFKHSDFIEYVIRNIPGSRHDIRKCYPAIAEVKPPQRIFVDLECIVDPLKSNKFWRDLGNVAKDDMIIDFLITNIKHESLHKAIFEIPEINYLLKENSYLLKDIDYERMEYIVAEMELELD